VTALSDRVAAGSHWIADCGCLLWGGAVWSGGIPCAGIGGRGVPTVSLRALVFTEAFGEVPEGMSVVMTCGCVSCLNHRHMTLAFTGSARNAPATDAKRAATHCKHGHELSGHNLIITRRGMRRCRICKNETMRAIRNRA
jgi:hypothetical protein